MYRISSHSDQIYVTLLRHLIRFLTCHQFLTYATIFLLQQLVSMAKFPLLAIAGNITNISEIYEMEIHDLFMSIWVRLECTADGDRPHVTLARVAAHDVLLSTFLPPGNIYGIYISATNRLVLMIHYAFESL